MADSERFELSVQLPVRILSRDVVSANSPNCPCLWSEIIGESCLKFYKIDSFFIIFFKNYSIIKRTYFLSVALDPNPTKDLG